MGHIMAIHTTGLIGITITTGIDVHIGITVTNHRKDTFVTSRIFAHLLRSFDVMRRKNYYATRKSTQRVSMT
jgi:hypothetical protein